MTSLPDRSLTLDIQQSQHFLALLGKPPATTCLRGFYPKGHPKLQEPKPDRGRKHPWWDEQVVAKWQAEGRNVYAVINDGGQSDQSISSCRALFCEWENRPKDWQLTAWRELGLPEPTLQVDSGGRSIHSYWVFNEPIEPSRWHDLQARLLEHTGSDRSLKNPSRVMRLPGCLYLTGAGHGAQPQVVTEIVTEAGQRYSADQLEQVLPPLVAAQPAASGVAVTAPGTTATTSHQPRDLAEIKSALAAIPAAVPGTGQYPTFRNLLWGLIDACRQVGADVEMAKELLREHSPLFKELDQVAASSSDQVTAGTFWYRAQQAGWKPRPSTTRAAGKGGGRSKDNPVCKLGPSEFRDLLPERLGQIRLNVRTRYIHLPDRVISPDEASLVYMKLSSPEMVWPKSTTMDALTYHANQAPFDPALEELEQLVAGVEPLPLDQWQRLDQVMLGIDDPIAAAFLPRYLVSAVARLYEPGCDVHQTPVLIGAQGIGKSWLGRLLFGDAYFGDQLGTKMDVDDVTRMAWAWGLELAELDGITRRADVESLKAFLTRSTDNERRKYSKGHEQIPRRTVFWGTSNSSPLRDATGSRRLLCIPLPDRKLPLEQVAAIRASLWARAVEQYRAKAKWWSTPEEVACIKERNEDHQQLDPWQIELDHFLSTKRNQHATGKGLPVPLHVTYKMLYETLDIKVEKQNNASSNRIRQIMASLGWKKFRLTIGHKKIHCFVPGSELNPAS